MTKILTFCVSAVVLLLAGCGSSGPVCHKVRHQGKTMCLVRTGSRAKYLPVVIYVPPVRTKPVVDNPPVEDVPVEAR